MEEIHVVRGRSTESFDEVFRGMKILSTSKKLNPSDACADSKSKAEPTDLVKRVAVHFFTVFGAVIVTIYDCAVPLQG